MAENPNAMLPFCQWSLDDDGQPFSQTGRLTSFYTYDFTYFQSAHVHICGRAKTRPAQLVLRYALVTGPLQIWCLHPWSYFEWSCMYNYDPFLFFLTAVSCGTLTIANGHVSTTGTTSGHTATYSCNIGYDLVGGSTRTCQDTGQWSGSAPTCHRMLFLPNMHTCVHWAVGQVFSNSSAYPSEGCLHMHTCTQSTKILKRKVIYYQLKFGK